MMKKQNKIYLVIGIIAIILLVGINYLAFNGSQEETIKIGIIGHFSGEYADYGIPMKNAVELAIKETNNAGGIDGKKLVLIVEDDGTDSAKSATGMNKLISIDNVNYILSAQGSGATSVVTPIANTNKKILMITLGSAPDLTTDKDYVFRSVPSDVYQASVMVDYLNGNLNPQKIAGLYRNDPYGIGIKNIVESGASADFVASELYDPTSSDFRTQLTKIKQANPDVLVIAGARDNYPTILKQAEELGITANIFASETFYDQDVLDKSGADNIEGIYTLFPEDPTDYVDFNTRYNQEFGTEPSAYSMYAYDGARSLIESIKNSEDNIERVRAELLILSFNGASEIVGFDKEGDRTGSKYSVYKVVNGKFVPFNK
jgi:branched-chain amino acid transport system substrate-binding protein